ncbi:unnamed protein product [Meganyctiphanes norvegica]|uniref:Methyltransferase domain-containing protein n=1 Tax=Meganyctiphanes norvegica TaxID=48144 RepID=A0AAV2PIF5_MEGNR
MQSFDNFIQNRLSMMAPSTDQIQKVLKQLTNFLEPLLSFANCHMVNFITHDHWNTFLNDQIKKDLEKVPIEQLSQIPTATLGLENEELDEWCLQGNLISFMAAVRKHHLTAINILTPLEEVLEDHGAQDISTIKMKGIMSEKKMHEVDIMSNIVARIAKGKNSTYIVDAGSGKGYLSSSLALQYNLNVLAIDSSCSNTSSAIQRNTRVQKYWESLQRSEMDKSDGKPARRGKNWKKKQAKMFQDDQIKKSEQGYDNQSDENKIQAEKNESLKLTVRKTNKVDTAPTNGKLIGITQFLLQDTNLLDLVNQSFNNTKYQLESIKSSENKVPNNICEQRSSDSNHKNASHTTLSGDLEDKPTLGIVGLHTCGNLASISLELLVSNPCVHFLCNVGCCYHLLKEEFCNDTYTKSTPKLSTDEDICPKDDRYENCSFDPLHPKENPNTCVGFPQSSYLKKRKFRLGRNARMLAAQATDRLEAQRTVNNTSLYWRALLQTLLLKKLGAVSDTYQVGRIAAKSSNFYEYVRKSAKKLDLPLEVTESEINSYLEDYSLDEKRLQRFFLLRSSLAPIIEGLILVDRLAYLSEQKTVTSAHLVQLFDPVASPRCHAVIAFKTP